MLGFDAPGRLTAGQFQRSVPASAVVTDIPFTQDGSDVQSSVVKIIMEWFWLSMFGGGPEKSAAQNAAAFVLARNKLRDGGTLHVGRGWHFCDPVAFTVPDGGQTTSLTILGAGAAGNATYINFQGSGNQKFWDFDAPAGASNGGSLNTVRGIVFYVGPDFTGTLISATTPVTDGLKIQSHFVMDGCTLAQIAGGSGGTLLDIGKSIISTISNTRFGGGACQIKGQQGQVVAGVAQARQSTTIDIRKCTFLNCNGYPILWGGEGWGVYDSVFEPTVGGRGRAFYTDANYPIRSMVWIGNWHGDFSGDDAEEMIVVHGLGFTFKGNYVGGVWVGGPNPWHAIRLDGVRVFDISTNVFDYCSAPIKAINTPRLGIIEANGYNVIDDEIVSGALHASVRVQNNGLVY